MWVRHQREELNIRLDGKEIKQVDGFVYLGGMVADDGHSEVEVRLRMQVGVNAWRKVEGVMLDRNILKRLKGKVQRECVTPACLYGLDKRVDKRRMKDLRKEVGMQCSLTEILLRSKMRWAGHLVRMDARKPAKRAEVEKHQGRRKRGRPQLIWEYCVRKDTRRSG